MIKFFSCVFAFEGVVNLVNLGSIVILYEFVCILGYSKM